MIFLTLLLLAVPSIWCSPFPLSSATLPGEYSFVTTPDAQGTSTCALCGSAAWAVSLAPHSDDKQGTLDIACVDSPLNFTFGGSYRAAGPVYSVSIDVYNNTRCTGSAIRRDGADAALLLLSCFYLQDDYISAQCDIILVNQHVSYYLTQVVWLAASTTGSLAFVCMAGYLICCPLKNPMKRKSQPSALHSVVNVNSYYDDLDGAGDIDDGDETTSLLS